MECCWEALEHSGYASENSREISKVGVFGSSGLNTYLLNNVYPISRYTEGQSNYIQNVLLANDKDYLSTRVSYLLNLKGPSMTTQTACSSSLHSIITACDNLVAKRCNVALAGGVSINFPYKVICFSQVENNFFRLDIHLKREVFTPKMVNVLPLMHLLLEQHLEMAV